MLRTPTARLSKLPLVGALATSLLAPWSALAGPSGQETPLLTEPLDVSRVIDSLKLPPSSISATENTTSPLLRTPHLRLLSAALHFSRITEDSTSPLTEDVLRTICSQTPTEDAIEDASKSSF